jgi:hypothetical protein
MNRPEGINLLIFSEFYSQIRALTMRCESALSNLGGELFKVRVWISWRRYNRLGKGGALCLPGTIKG